MKSKKIVLPLLLIYCILLASAEIPANNRTSATEASLQERTNRTSSTASIISKLLDENEAGKPRSDSAPLVDVAIGQQGNEQDQATSPSMTSVHHQVWTSSSSGSLDELSPEIISKLRADVPFLAAYALRPRLVGASSSLARAGKDESQTIRKEGGLLASASQQDKRRQISGLPLVSGPSLSDFNELKVETSSTSKSEHHHNRKTTLKKQPTSGEQSNRRRLILAATSRLMIERRRKSGNKRNTSLASKSSRSKVGKQSGRLRSQASKLRRKLNRSNRKHHMSIIRHGRQQQQAAVSPPLNKLPDEGKTNPDEDDGGVKGGSKRVEPFYKRRNGERPSVVVDKKEEEEEPQIATNDLGGDEGERGDDKKPDRESVGPEKDEETDDDQAQLEPPEPRRVGDPDVDEVEGDTVTVMPKFDGVDDDPEIPIEESEAPQGGTSGGGGGGDDDDGDGGMTREREAPQNDARGRRVGREKSNEGGSMVAGGGIGATTGGSGGAGDSVGDSRTDDSDQRVGSDEDKAGEGRGTKPRTESGVEFARDDDDGDVDDKAREPAGHRAGSKGQDRMEDADGDRVGERPFDSRRVGSDDGQTSSGGRRDDTGRDERRDDEDSRDVDYRDDDDKKGAARGKDRGGSAAKEPTDLGSGSDSREPKRAGDRDGRLGMADKGHHEKRPECDDHHGHYDHHHSHHDGIKWLQDAIPGEPGQDYPILSRVNLTNFNCRDQKYAGYYADVESRCQIFHICQADGRQDSFLCPNGTIFSQISRVCVWWNSFDCEDAPKFYALNAQLYSNKKQHVTSDHDDGSSMRDLRPLDGSRINPNDGSVDAADRGDDGDDSSSIDSLIRSMKRRQQMDERSSAHDNDDTSMFPQDRGVSVMMDQARRVGLAGAKSDASGDGSGLSDEDEASIQRKSTKLAAADEQEGEGQDRASNGASSRLRHNNEPRRRRRASVRQAPPKLKSRRVSRNSRRRKLRHGIKPKRRA